MNDRIERVMALTGMGRLQAYRHIEQRDRLRQQLREARYAPR